MHPLVKRIIKKNSDSEWLVEMKDGSHAIWIDVEKGINSEEHPTECSECKDEK